MFHNIRVKRVVSLFSRSFTLIFTFVLTLALVPISSALAHGPIHSTNPVLGPFNCASSDAECEKVGHSKIARFHDGVGVKLHTTELIPGDTYTLWWIVFNKPENCVDGCGEDDLSRDSVMASVLWAAGRVADPYGNASFNAFLWQGHHNGEIRRGQGLLHPTTAEIHFVVRSHGPQLRGQVHDQLYTHQGGCETNECVDVQFSVHLPIGEKSKLSH